MTDVAGRLGPVIRLAPAKINLTLAVVGRRADGFHDLHSVFVPLDLADVLSLAAAGPGRGDTLHVSGRETGPVAENLVLRGIAAARAAVGEGPGRPPTPALAARLDKRIPVAAGLGGGSSDGAAAFDGALEAWAGRDHVDPERRWSAAARIGSDVPFFLAGGPALVEGRGDRVTTFPHIVGEAGVLLVTPRIAMRTPDVFATFAATRGSGDGSVRMTSQHLAQELAGGMTSADLVTRAGVLAVANDLLASAAIVEPGLVPVRRAVMRTLGRPVGLSGSGPTLWTLYASRSEADGAAATLAAAIADGRVPALGGGPPEVIATTIRARGEPDPQPRPAADKERRS